jgi:hypothetical protein
MVNRSPSPGTSLPGDLGTPDDHDGVPFFTHAQQLEIATLMALRREYTLKALSRRYRVSVKTLYRIARRYRPDVTRNGTPPRNDE